MRLRLTGGAPRRGVVMRVMRVMRVMLAMLVILIASVPRALVAEDRMTIRGNYYREASTRPSSSS